MSRNNRQPIKVSQLVGHSGKVIVVVGKILDDVRLLTLPRLTVVALNVSREAKNKIRKFGGEVYTLDKLFQISNDLKDIVLVSGDRTRRKAYKFFGCPGEKNSITYPRTINKKNSGEKRINNPKRKMNN